MMAQRREKIQPDKEDDHAADQHGTTVRIAVVGEIHPQRDDHQNGACKEQQRRKHLVACVDFHTDLLKELEG